MSKIIPILTFKQIRNFIKRIVWNVAPNECWFWNKRSVKERARFPINGVPFIAAHVMYKVFYGIDPGTLFVCHTCDNGLCVNPSHLWLGTQKQNMQDMAQKNRHSRYELKKTHCPKGHPYDEKNTYHTPRGSRHCKTCKSIARIVKSEDRAKPKTHCKRGHEFNSVNTGIHNRPDGSLNRYCRRCKNDREKLKR